MRVFFIYLILSFLIIPGYGQGTKRAKKLYDDFGYKSSISVFEKEMSRKDKKLNYEEMRQIANSYRLIHDTQNAEKWYTQFIDDTTDEKDYLHYAQVLHSNGKLDLARKYFLQYDDQFGDKDNRGQILAQAIDRMDNFTRDGVEIKNERHLNSKKIEFSPRFYGDGIVFVTTNNPKVASKKDVWLDDNFMSLYVAERNNNGALQSPNPFSEKLKSKFHEGPVSFSKTGDQIFYTKSNYAKGRKILSEDGVLKLQIYTAFKKKDKWSNISALPFNTEETDDVHPSLSADGLQLFFASNRKGGHGGMDLYVSNFKNGQWSDPENLGPQINTPGNEIFPFIHDDGTLYFSSDGHAGIGGLDIFTTVVYEKAWTAPTNMGSPINSNMDDLGFIINTTNSEGYFSSDRDDGIGKDDIYSFRVLPENLKKPIIERLNAEICTYLESSNEPVANVTIRATENITFGDDDDLIFTTNSEGLVTMQLDAEKAYKFRTEKNGYHITEKVFSTEGIKNKDNISFCIGMKAEQDNCAALAGIVTNSVDGSRIPNATVVITNNCTGKMYTLSSNLLGEFDGICLSCDCSYKIQGLKNGYEASESEIETSNLDCSTNQTLYYNIQLNSLNDNSNLSSKITKSSDPFRLGIGTNIVMEDIYYDFDKYNIRQDAAVSLDRLAGMLRSYPTLEIKLSAHTDSRGDADYNQSLSHKRAKAAKNYLLASGISDYRISVFGAGENQIRNHCIDNVNCSESQHQYNRRTEISITSIGQESVTMTYSKSPTTFLSSPKTTPQQSITYQNDIPLNNSQHSNASPSTFSGEDYKVQIFCSESPDRYFGDLSDLGNIQIEPVNEKGLSRYLIGDRLSYQEAMNLLPKIQERGLNKAFIVTYKNGIRQE